MSIATSTSPRRRKPRLKVVGLERRPPRHRVSWRECPRCSIVEFWTLVEWEQLAEWERPPNAGFLPGIGYVHLLENVSPEERAEVVAEYSDNIVRWAELRGGAL